MRVTISLDEKLIITARKIAAKRKISLSKLVREHLEQLLAASNKRNVGNLEALQKTFEKSHFKTGKRTWKRADLHERH